MSMNRAEAEEALTLIRRVVNRVHDETVVQNWGTVMVVVGCMELHQGRDEPPSTSVFRSRAELDGLVLDHSDAFGHVPGNAHVYVLLIDRDAWRYRFVSPRELYLGYFQEGRPFDRHTARLDSVLHCRDIAYRWQPLRRETIAAC